MTPPLPLLETATIATPAHTLAAIDTTRLMVGGTLTLFIVVCVLLVLTILIQKPQGGGLSGAFGAGASGSGQTAFGTKTGDALTWMTIGMFIIYLGAAIGMNYAMRPTGPTPPPAPVIAPVPGPGTPPGTNGTAPATKPADATTPPATAPKTETTPPSSSTINVKPSEPGSTPVVPAPAPTPGTDTPANPPVANPPVANPPAATPPATSPPANPPANPPKP